MRALFSFLSIFITLAPVLAHADLTDPRVVRFQADIEAIQNLRKQTLEFYDRVNPIVQAHHPLTGEEMATLDSLAKAHSGFAKELETFLPGKPEKLDVLDTSTTANAITVELALAASLTFADSVEQVLTIFDSNDELRKILNRANPSYDRPSNILYATLQRYYSTEHYDRRASLISLFQVIQYTPVYDQSAELAYLGGVITQSPVYLRYVSQTEKQRKAERKTLLHERTELEAAKARDKLEDFFTHKVVGALSQGFGNAVGAIQFRHGKLYGNRQIADQMKAILKPGDLLLEATPFRATSYFIPGFYGHVALWIGTEQELKDMNLWDDPTIKPYQAKIHTGSSILEALRDGVAINPVEHFLDIDDLLIIRPNVNRIDGEQIRDAITSGMTHVGQGYDFNFDNETNDKIVCSELAYATYTMVDWTQERTLGRWTINPDAVAEQALPNRFFTPVMMVRDGVPVTEDLQDALAQEIEKKAKKSSSTRISSFD